MSFVLDASIAVSWAFPDEEWGSSMKLLDKLETEFAYVPSLWSLEVGNAVLMAERKKRITYADVREFFSILQNLNIKVDEQTDLCAFHEIFTLAKTQGLTTYDAAYLELAMRMGLSLATRDQLLANAAKKLGVEVINQ